MCKISRTQRKRLIINKYKKRAIYGLMERYFMIILLKYVSFRHFWVAVYA
jgi:hypothetical protein